MRYAIDDSRSSSRSCVCLFFVFLIDSYVECARSPTLLLSLLLSVATAAAEIGAAATAAVAVAVPLPQSLLPGQPGVIITSPFCALSLPLSTPTWSLSFALSQAWRNLSAVWRAKQFGVARVARQTNNGKMANIYFLGELTTKWRTSMGGSGQCEMMERRAKRKKAGEKSNERSKQSKQQRGAWSPYCLSICQSHKCKCHSNETWAKEKERRKTEERRGH